MITNCLFHGLRLVHARPPPHITTTMRGVSLLNGSLYVRVRRCHTVVLIGTSLTTNGVDHLFV